MDSDRFTGQESEGLPEQASEKDKTVGAAGATGLFGGLPQEPAKASEGPARTLPVVHSVVFKADSSRAEGTDQLLNILRSPALKPDVSPETPASPSQAASSGGFTQLLRALNYDQAKDPAKTEQSKPVQAAAAPSGAAQAPASPLPQVTSFQTQPASNATPGSFTQLFQASAPPIQETAKAEIPPVAAVPGSFTQMFQALNAAPVEPAIPVPESPATPAGKAPDVGLVVPVASPGSFTQMFRTLDASPAEQQPTAEASAPGSFTQMFAAVGSPAAEPMKAESVPAASVESPSPNLVKEDAAAAPLPAAGSFTQMFRALDAAPMENATATPATEPPSFTQMFSTPAPPPVQTAPEETPRPVPAAASGSFTQMFRALDAAPADAKRVEPSTPAPAAGPGSFTQMFQAVSSPPAEPTHHQTPAGAPGTFTQMFSTPTAPVVEPSRPESPPPPASGSFTQMFRTLDAAPLPLPSAGSSAASGVDLQGPPVRNEERAGQPFSPFENTAPRQPAPSPSIPAAGGGLTQLLRTLDQPSQPSTRPYVPPAPAPPLGGQQPGSFTSVYGTLKDEAPAQSAPQPTVQAPPQQPFSPAAGKDATQAFRMPQFGAMPPAPAPVEAGPSEFTRILNASMLRESALKGGGEASVPPAAAAPPAGSAGAPPWAMPAAPKMPEAPKLPQAPKVPEVKLPAAPKAAVPTGMQQYLPLLLILIVFLLLAILVAVVFLMKR